MAVQHDMDKKRFYIEVEGKQVELTYQVESDGHLNYNSTFTPPELRGQGLAGQVTKAALQFAQVNKKKVEPSCPYVADYIKRHPEFQDLLK